MKSQGTNRQGVRSLDRLGISLLALLGAMLLVSATKAQRPQDRANPAVDVAPQFEWDPTWPKPLPDNMVMGAVGGVAVDPQNNVWVVHSPGALGKAGGEATSSETLRNFGKPASPILEFDQSGNLLHSMGRLSTRYDWMKTEHAIHVDANRNIWVGGSGDGDDQILKLGPSGRFMLQIGKPGQGRGSNDLQNLGSPASIEVDSYMDEVYVADGYHNRRVIVFDATTGAYKRHWGAYGSRPDDNYQFAGGYLRKLSGGDLPKQFKPPVHCVKMASDGFIYVCDSANGRIQVFYQDGTFVKEFLIWPRVTADLGFSADTEQRYMYVTDFIHERVWILQREDGKIIGSFGHPGHYGGEFTNAHNLAVDHLGNIYVTEGLEGRRVQRFLYKGLGTIDPSAIDTPAQFDGRFEAIVGPGQRDTPASGAPRQ
jgi:DNA-binding beta-propeller fold protein YncE